MKQILSFLTCFLFKSVPLRLLINIHIFEISEMTPTFESALLLFSPGVNSSAELLAHAQGVRPKWRLARRWLGD